MKMNGLEVIYSKVGQVVAMAQRVEYHLATIFALNEVLKNQSPNMIEVADEWFNNLNNNTMGSVIKAIKEVGLFTTDAERTLSKVLRERNYIVHQLFKEDIIKQEYSKKPEPIIQRLSQLLKTMDFVNDQLLQVITNLQNQYKKRATAK